MTVEETVRRQGDLIWVKSSYSDNEGGECVEVAWRKSSHSDAAGDNCVEVAEATSAVHVRDSRNPAGPRLTVPRSGWTRFLQYATAR